MNQIPKSTPAMWPAIFLTLVAGGYRVLAAWLMTHGGATSNSWLLGFFPLSAFALCGGRFLPARLAFVVAPLLLLASDILVDRFYGVSLFDPQVLLPFACLTTLILAGAWMRQCMAGTGALLLATLCASVLFYVVTNTQSWLCSTQYAHTLSGWTQALTVGLPGFPPSWIFFRNGLVSDVLYSIMMAVGCQSGWDFWASLRHGTGNRSASAH